MTRLATLFFLLGAFASLLAAGSAEGATPDFLSALEARPADCPAGLDKHGMAAEARCGTVDLDWPDVKQAVRRVLGTESFHGLDFINTGWTEVDGLELRRLEGNERLTLLFFPETHVLAVLPSPSCLRTSPLPPRNEPGVTLPKLAHKTRVDYPEKLRQEQADAAALVEVLIGADGAVVEACVAVARPLGYGVEEAVLQAIKGWRYEPASEDGRPTSFQMTVSIEFSLHDLPR